MKRKNRDWLDYVKPAIHHRDYYSNLQGLYYTTDKVNPEFINEIINKNFETALEIREENLRRNPDRKVISILSEEIDCYARFAASRLVDEYEESLSSEDSMTRVEYLEEKIDDLSRQYGL